MPNNLKDFIETTCICGRRFMRPYPSLQKRPSLAPSIEEARVTQELLVLELTHHQNHNCHPVTFRGD